MTEQQELEPVAIATLATVTGGYHDPAPSNNETGIAGLSPAPCTPPPSSRPSSWAVWIPI